MKRSLAFARRLSTTATRVRYQPVTRCLPNLIPMTSIGAFPPVVTLPHGVRFVSSHLLDQTRFFLDQSSRIDTANPEVWAEVDFILRSWLETQQNSDVPPLKRVECCLRILDRLAAALPQGDTLFASLLQTDILHALLTTWQEGLSVPSEAADDDRTLRRRLSPSFLASKIDKYRWVSLLQPDSKTFNLLFKIAGAHFSFRDGVLFADQLLRKLVEVSGDNDNIESSMQPLMDVISIATVMQAWVNHRQPEKAEEWLSLLHSWKNSDSDYLATLRPTIVHYTTVLSGWAKLGNSDRAMRILDMQQQDYCDGNLEAQPDLISFNCALDALAKSNHPSALEKSKRILQLLKETCTPDAHTWSTILACYVKHKPGRASKFLRTLERDGVVLTIAAYNTLLRSYAKRGDIASAEKLVERIKELDGIEADTVTFNTLLSTISNMKRSDTDKAVMYFDQMLECGLSPTARTYSSLMQCWSKSKDPSAAQRVEGIFASLQQFPDFKHNITFYNIIINAWGNHARLQKDSKGVDRVMKLLHDLLEEKNIKPSDATFRSVIHAIIGSHIQARKKVEAIESLLPLMQTHGFKPNKNDEKILRRVLRNGKQS